MGRITDVPASVTDAGQDHVYTGPPRLAHVVLVNAPLDPDHENVGLNRAAYDTFIAGEITTGRAYVADVNLQDPHHDLVLPIEYETAATFYNYGRVTIGTRTWYVFYTPVYDNKENTRFVADIDEFPTYDWNLGFSEIERGHYAVAASASGTIGYCLEPEPFTPRDLYGVAAYQHDPLGAPAVLVISTVDLRANPWVQVDADVANTASDQITDTLASGSIEAPFTPGGSETFPYSIGNSGSTWDDHYFYPYAAASGLHPGNIQYRPYVTGASPSLVDGIAAEGGAFVYSSVGAYLNHMALLAHVPWMVGGISRAVLIRGGANSGAAAVPLTPWDHISGTAGSPAYHASLTTAVDYNVNLVADWRDGLPAAYDTWTKLRTAPYAEIEIGDRQGARASYDPAAFTGLGTAGALVLHVQGAFHPTADVAVWLNGAEGLASPNSPMSSPVGADLPHFAVGRDLAFSPGAASHTVDRSQSIVDMLLAAQRASVDAAFTLASSYTATNYAVVEST